MSEAQQEPANESKSDQIRALLKSGMMPSQIAKKLGTSTSYVYNLRNQEVPNMKAKKKSKPGRKKKNAETKSAVTVSRNTDARIGHYFFTPDAPMAFATEKLARDYLGEKATLSKIAVLLH